jgi:hypothetical protein
MEALAVPKQRQNPKWNSQGEVQKCSPSYTLRRKFFTFALIAFCSGAVSQAAAVDIHPGDDIPTVVAANPAGTTFVIYPGTYRLKQNIVPKTGDRFIGQTACAPPTTSCRAIIIGSTVIGSLAKFDGTQIPTTRAAFLRWR